MLPWHSCICHVFSGCHFFRRVSDPASLGCDLRMASWSRFLFALHLHARMFVSDLVHLLAVAHPVAGSLWHLSCCLWNSSYASLFPSTLQQIYFTSSPSQPKPSPSSVSWNPQVVHHCESAVLIWFLLCFDRFSVGVVAVAQPVVGRCCILYLSVSFALINASPPKGLHHPDEAEVAVLIVLTNTSSTYT